MKSQTNPERARSVYISKWGSVLACVVLLSAIFVYYNADHVYPPCCDTAITLMKAKQIVNTGTLQALQTYNPSAQQPLYGSPISTEASLHVLLSSLLQFFPAGTGSLQFAKVFFVALFALPALSLLLLARRIFHSFSLSLLSVLLTYLSFWFGNMYWTGHVAQMLGVFFLGLALYFLVRYHEQRHKVDLLWTIFITGVIFFTHVLTFLVVYIILVSYLIVQSFNSGKSLAVTSAVFFLYAGALFLFLWLTPVDSEASSLLPRFAINESGERGVGIFSSAFPQVFTAVLFILGLVMSILRKRLILLLWFVVAYLLSQSAFLGTPFYAFRYNEFVIIPLTFFLVFGISVLAQRLQPRFAAVAVALVVIVLLPGMVMQQERLKACYVNNCTGLHPTQIPQADVEAFLWIDEHLSSPSVFAGTQKFGYYLPIVSDHYIEFPVGEKRDLLVLTDSLERWKLAKKYRIQFIYWSAIFSESNGQFLELEDFTQTPFADENYFKKIYDDRTVIYQVL